ncbi:MULTISPECIES: hypothetical protein [unclassified Actinobaculum]|uniref:hypothetical protein n=1 Tax=unclassified Actinobaculum TaxID=2609299 RepID=UPI000D5287CA|nr:MULTISPECIES: hypothetical protein [unclassified Actinobaculum]AWE41583.1 hypothetical protein DDD63_01015 [Actinobaculum sp. 313]RTE49202.1 hypothetical protein EKN07_06390 [Actinobaculum sp. 352]
MALEFLFAESALWSALWMVLVSISVRRFPFTMEHDYPEDVRKVANIKPPSSRQKRTGMLFATLSLSLTFALLVFFGVSGIRDVGQGFLPMFIRVWVICMVWNVVDLVVVDWFLICALACKYFLLPGTEGYTGNKNYRFHFKGFLKGSVAMTCMASIAAGVAYGIMLWT